MRTRRPISTISYNSQSFLVARLNELIKNHVIDDYFFINHFAENDETKNHIHLWISPNKTVDTMELQDHFIELNIKDPKKPFKCMPFESSNCDDAVLYFMHYEPYLDYKNEKREFHYSFDDFVFYDEDYFIQRYNHAMKGSSFATNMQKIEKLKLAQSYNDLVAMALCGSIPMQQYNNYRSFMTDKMQLPDTFRNGRKGHEEFKEGAVNE